MSSVRIWHGWLIAGAQKPHASLSVYRWQLHYIPPSPQCADGGRWRLTVVRTGRRAPYAGARETHICSLCAPRHSARVPFS